MDNSRGEKVLEALHCPICIRNFGFPRRETGGTQSLAKDPEKDKQLFPKQLIPALSGCLQREKTSQPLWDPAHGEKIPLISRDFPYSRFSLLSSCCDASRRVCLSLPCSLPPRIKKMAQKNLGSINQIIGNGHMATFLNPEISPFVIKQEPPSTFPSFPGTG